MNELIAKLEALAEKWEGHIEYCSGYSEYPSGVEMGMQRCAYELLELLEKERGDL